MENDILLEGIIEYTKDKKLKWEIYHEQNLISEYKCKYPIIGNKSIFIRFYCNYKNMKLSGLDVSISYSNRISTYKYMSSSDFKHNRLEELSKLVIKQLNKGIITNNY